MNMRLFGGSQSTNKKKEMIRHLNNIKEGMKYSKERGYTKKEKKEGKKRYERTTREYEIIKEVLHSCCRI